MNKKILFIGLSLALLLIGIIVAVAQAQNNDSESQSSDTQTSENRTAELSDELGDDPNDKSNHGVVTDPYNETDEPTVVEDFGDMPESARKKAIEFAKAWVTFDTADDKSVRVEQLSKYITNADEWGSLRSNALTTANGNPTWRTVAGLNPNGVVDFIDDASWAGDGNYEFEVAMDVQAEDSSGGGRDRGTRYGYLKWRFVVTQDWELLSVDEPTWTQN